MGPHWYQLSLMGTNGPFWIQTGLNCTDASLWVKTGPSDLAGTFLTVRSYSRIYLIKIENFSKQKAGNSKKISEQTNNVLCCMQNKIMSHDSENTEGRTISNIQKIQKADV